MEDFLSKHFRNSAMNVCQTQPLTKMKVDDMTVEFKNDEMKNKPIRKTRIIQIPLPLRDQTKRDLDAACKMGILEDRAGKNNHDLWLAPMIVVPKKDNSPRRVIDFSLLNRYCKRSATVTLDTNRMATAVPVPNAGE